MATCGGRIRTARRRPAGSCRTRAGCCCPASSTPTRWTSCATEIGAVYDDRAARRASPGPGPRRVGAVPLRDAEPQRRRASGRSPSRRILDVVEPLLGEDCHVIANTAWRQPAAVEHSHGGRFWHIDSGPHVPRAARRAVGRPHPVPGVRRRGATCCCRTARSSAGPTGVIPRQPHLGTPAAPGPAERPRPHLGGPRADRPRGRRRRRRSCSCPTSGTAACRPARATPAGSSSSATTAAATSPNGCARRPRPTSSSPEAVARAVTDREPHPRRPAPAVLLRRLTPKLLWVVHRGGTRSTTRTPDGLGGIRGR